MKTIAVLAVLVVSLISVSSAAGPRAMPDIYKGQCGVELSVPAPGILTNDIKSASPLQVKDPEKISIDPKYGTLKVSADGSFVYDAAQNIPTSTYVTFNYAATDGISITSLALVKIAVSCKCHGAAPDITVCLDSVAITPDFLMSKGAGCMGCRDATPKFDLRKIPARPVAGATYPYTVSCPSCNVVTGHVTFVGPCDVSWNPFPICAGAIPTPVQVLVGGSITCSCDTAPIISNIHLVGDHWEYTITCQSECGPKTVIGRVNIETPCVPTSVPFAVCSGITPTVEMITESGDITCGSGVCDTTPVISDINMEDDDHWVYTITCTTELGCEAKATGIVNIEAPCVPAWDEFIVCSGVIPTEAQILAEGKVSCGSGVCDTTPKISNIHLVDDHWEYTITCTTALDCIATDTGIVNIDPACEISFLSFTIESRICPSHQLPTVEEVMNLGFVSCGSCDTTPAISNIHWWLTPSDDEWVGNYTITCATPNDCTKSEIGHFNSPPCEELCLCAPNAPNLCGCVGFGFPMELFTSLDGGCHPEPGCDVTPTYTIDYSNVDFSKASSVVQHYTVTCEGCGDSPVTATGGIYISNPTCAPGDVNCECDCCV
jgi:hypothetical protein